MPCSRWGKCWEVLYEETITSRRDGAAYFSNTGQKKSSSLVLIGLALFQKKEVIEGPLWEMTSPLLASDDAVKKREAAFFQK